MKASSSESTTNQATSKSHKMIAVIKLITLICCCLNQQLVAAEESTTKIFLHRDRQQNDISTVSSLKPSTNLHNKQQLKIFPNSTHSKPDLTAQTSNKDKSEEHQVLVASSETRNATGLMSSASSASPRMAAFQPTELPLPVSSTEAFGSSTLKHEQPARSEQKLMRRQQQESSRREQLEQMSTNQAISFAEPNEQSSIQVSRRSFLEAAFR